jgi:type I restriction enzyme S subunit
MKPEYDHYKPSGIDWIGDVPEHWKVMRLKYFCELIPVSDQKDYNPKIQLL